VPIFTRATVIRSNSTVASAPLGAHRVARDLGTVGVVRGRGTQGSAGGDFPRPAGGAGSGIPYARVVSCAVALGQAPRALRRVLVILGIRPFARPNRRRAGGFFRPLPWLQSAQDLPHPTLSAMTGLVVAVVGIATVIALITASGQPTLPSSHAVLVSVNPSAGHTAQGGGHLIWYRTGGLLVVVLGVQHLQPKAQVSALLVPKGSCTAPRPTGTRVIGTVRANGHGVATFNEELLSVSSLKFSAWSIWIEGQGQGQGRSPAACGVISLAGGTLITS